MSEAEETKKVQDNESKAEKFVTYIEIMKTCVFG